MALGVKVDRAGSKPYRPCEVEQFQFFSSLVAYYDKIDTHLCHIERILQKKRWCNSASQLAIKKEPNEIVFIVCSLNSLNESQSVHKHMQLISMCNWFRVAVDFLLNTFADF